MQQMVTQIIKESLNTVHIATTAVHYVSFKRRQLALTI